MQIASTCLVAFTVFCTALAVAPSNAAAQQASWPQFRGPHRNGVSDSKGLLSEWPDEGPRQVWQTAGAGRGYSSVAIADGKLYTMGDAPSTADDEDEYLLCFAVDSGRQLWKTRLGIPWTEGPSDWQSSRSTPTVDGKLIYALTAHGDLVCAQTADGRELWRKNLREDLEGKKGDGWGYSESVLVDGNLLLCTPGGEKNTLVALSKFTGELIWSASREGDRGAGHASIVVSQVAGVRAYIQTTASGALGVRAGDGKLMWSYEIDDTTAVIPTPVVRDDLVFFTAGYGLGGALLRQELSDDDLLDITELYPPNPRLQNKHGGVILLDDQIYGDSGDDGIPFCADLMTGEVLWKKRGSGRGSAAIVAADGHLYIWFSDTTLALVRATPDAYQEISRLQLQDAGDRPSWAHPVIAGGRLYLRVDDQILCYELRASRQ